MDKYTFSAIGAGLLWGACGLFTRSLTALGFATWGIVAVRCGIAALAFLLLALITDRGALKIKPRDAWIFVGVGIVSMLFFTYCYFTAIELMEMSTASILLYTAPCFVMLFSRIFFGDRIGVRGIVSLVLCVGGVALVSGIGGAISAKGFAFGMCSGIGYALFSIFSRAALNRGYKSVTINFYGCAIASVGAMCFGGFAEPWRMAVSSGSAALLTLGIGILVCFLPYLLYTYSLTGTSNGMASIMASVEPVMATVLGVIVYRDRLTALSACGIVLVLAAIVVMNSGTRKSE